MRLLLVVLFLAGTAGTLHASKRDARSGVSLASYIARVQTEAQTATPTPGSCWVDSGRLGLPCHRLQGRDGWGSDHDCGCA